MSAHGAAAAARRAAVRTVRTGGRGRCCEERVRQRDVDLVVEGDAEMDDWRAGYVALAGWVGTHAKVNEGQRQRPNADERRTPARRTRRMRCRFGETARQDWQGEQYKCAMQEGEPRAHVREHALAQRGANRPALHAESDLQRTKGSAG